MSPAVDKLVSTTLVDRVTERLRRAIELGQFAPGSRLVEQEIAALFGISRGPIREALKRLASESLVVDSNYKGCSVMEPTAADVAEVYSLRASIEALAVRLAVGRLTPADFDELRRLSQEMITTRKSSAPAALDLDTDFHTFLFTHSGHGRLLRVWNQLRSQVRLLMTLSRKTIAGRLKGAYEEHQQLIAALEHGDADRAEAIIRNHIERAGRLLMDVIEAEGVQR